MAKWPSPAPTRNAAAALDEAQQRLSRLLLAEHPEMQAIIEAGDLVARLEREALRRPLLKMPVK